MEFVADILHHLLHRAAADFAFLDFAGAPVDDFVPLRFRIGVHGVVETGDLTESIHMPTAPNYGAGPNTLG
jgi:hypothetical protein